MEWVINFKFSEPSKSLKWPREQGEEALPQRNPVGNSHLDSPVVTTEGWEADGRLSISPELVPQGPLGLQMGFVSAAALSCCESCEVSLSSGCLI